MNRSGNIVRSGPFVLLPVTGRADGGWSPSGAFRRSGEQPEYLSREGVETILYPWAPT